MDLAHQDTPDLQAIESIGGGWTGHEALAIAIYSAVKHQDSFEEAVISCVNHSGDSDSTGAVCGNIMGCLLGYEAIPAQFTDRLELKDVLEEIAHDLWTGCIISEHDPIDTPEKKRWEQKYCKKRRTPAQ
jgi:ADP-ribosylglycohydrolase